MPHAPSFVILSLNSVFNVRMTLQTPELFCFYLPSPRTNDPLRLQRGCRCREQLRVTSHQFRGSYSFLAKIRVFQGVTSRGRAMCFGRFGGSFCVCYLEDRGRQLLTTVGNKLPVKRLSCPRTLKFSR
jgi:hypothetical protein